MYTGVRGLRRYRDDSIEFGIREAFREERSYDCVISGRKLRCVLKIDPERANAV